MSKNEKLSTSIESTNIADDVTINSLLSLEKESRYKVIENWLKKIFSSSTKEKSSDTNSPNFDVENGSDLKAWYSNTDRATWNIDYSKVDTRWFTPWAYPFKHITTPYKWIPAYRVDNIKLNPLIWFNQLSLKWTEWNLTTLKVKDQKLHFSSTKTTWYKKNNPCNVSPFQWDVWRISSSKVADWQNHSKYQSMEDWLASFMRLMRQSRYRNKSIQWINCSWMQWIYKQNEPDSLKALRVTWITRACNNLHVSPFDRLNTDDKETMMAFTQQTAINESWSYFDRATLERAYEKAFW